MTDRIIRHAGGFAIVNEDRTVGLFRTREEAEEKLRRLSRATHQLWLLGRDGTTVSTRAIDLWTTHPTFLLQLQDAIDVAHDALRTAFDIRSGGDVNDKLIAMEICGGFPPRMRATDDENINRARDILCDVLGSTDPQIEWLMGFIVHNSDGVIVRGLDQQREDKMRRLDS